MGSTPVARTSLDFLLHLHPRSITGGDFYVGITEDLRARLKAHNAGEVPHTAKRRPWRVKTAIAFTDKARAINFERYLKTSSGRAFAKKRL